MSFMFNSNLFIIVPLKLNANLFIFVYRKSVSH